MGAISRIIDANLNRSREGLRVCEDIARFALNDKSLTSSFKSARHRLTRLSGRLDSGLALTFSRNVKKDIGRKTSPREKRRKDIKGVFCANIQRAKESLRSLEEITKLADKKTADEFKKTRFRVYELEKTSRAKFQALLRG